MMKDDLSKKKQKTKNTIALEHFFLTHASIIMFSSTSAYTSNADMIQPGLTPLQPNLDDFMDIPGTFYPFICPSVYL